MSKSQPAPRFHSPLRRRGEGLIPPLLPWEAGPRYHQYLLLQTVISQQSCHQGRTNKTRSPLCVYGRVITKHEPGTFALSYILSVFYFYFETGTHWVPECPGWAQIFNHPTSAFHSAGIMDMNHCAPVWPLKPSFFQCFSMFPSTRSYWKIPPWGWHCFSPHTAALQPLQQVTFHLFGLWICNRKWTHAPWDTKELLAKCCFSW